MMEKLDRFSFITDLKRFPSSLLHTDWRPANLPTREGEIGDFSNALVCPAAVKIYRVRELQHLGLDFI